MDKILLGTHPDGVKIFRTNMHSGSFYGKRKCGMIVFYVQRWVMVNYGAEKTSRDAARQT